jgi:DNA-binding GntR family transcriptional regulator
MRSVGKARYAQLAESLLEKISKGEYPVGTLMPTEVDLCRQFGVSRITVREAIRQLSDMGLISRKPGVGTQVRARHASPRFVHAIESISDIFQYTQGSGKPVVLAVAEIEADENEAELLQCPPGQRWVRFESVRTFAGKRVPMVLTEAYVPPAYERLPKLAEKRSDPMYAVLEREYGEPIVEVQQEFRAVQINAKQAHLLAVKPGWAGLYVIRHYFGGGQRLLLVTLSIYPSDRFSYAMRLRYNRAPKKGLE